MFIEYLLFAVLQKYQYPKQMVYKVHINIDQINPIIEVRGYLSLLIHVYKIIILIDKHDMMPCFQTYLCKPVINTLRPRQNGRHFAHHIFKCILLNENVWTTIKTSLKFVTKGPFINIPALVQIKDWRRPGGKPLSEPMLVSLPTHICVTRRQWVNGYLVATQHNGDILAHYYIGT